MNQSSSLGTKDFVAAMKARGLTLIPYVPESGAAYGAIMPLPPLPTSEEPRELLFGRHIREAIQAWKRLRKRH